MSAIFTKPITKKDIKEAAKLSDSPLTPQFSFTSWPKPVKVVKHKAIRNYRDDGFLAKKQAIRLKKKKVAPTATTTSNLTYSKRKQTGRVPSYIKWGSKYGNIPSQYKGRLYHSKKEAEYAMILDDMVKHREILKWIPQFTLKLDVSKKHICNYIADFKVYKGVDSVEIHETKGYFTDTAKLKWRLAQALYPQYKFILIK
jgi:hypothetical protein